MQHTKKNTFTAGYTYLSGMQLILVLVLILSKKDHVKEKTTSPGQQQRFFFIGMNTNYLAIQINERVIRKKMCYRNG